MSQQASLTKLLPFIRPYKIQIGLALFALVFTSGVMLSLGQGVSYLIDQGIASGSRDALRYSILFFLLLVALVAIGSFFRFYLVSWIGEKVVADLRKAVFSHLIHLHPAFFEEQKSGEIQSRITTDTTLLQSVIGSSISIALRNSIMLVGGTVLLFITNAKLTLIVLLSVPLVIAPILFFGRRVRALSKTTQDEIAKVGGHVGESLRHIKVVQSLNQQQNDSKLFNNMVDQAFFVSVQRIRQRAFLSVVVITLSMSAIGVMLWVGGNDVMQGRISAGDLGGFLFYAIIVAVAVAAISEVMGELQRAAGAAERLIELLNTPNKILSGADALPPIEEAESADSHGVIRFEQVVFQYSSRDKAAINDVNLTIQQGERVALVGPSGAGKSTLLELLLRFYDVDMGRICIYNKNIKDMALETLRSQLAIVPQQPVLFDMTVAQNIAYAKPEATQAEIENAAQAAHADEFIQQLPDGYDSDLGENGVRLSGGQQQRIAIARAILKDAPILLLDEATSALDAQSEHHVQQALEHLMQGRTSLIIAHRLATVLNADRIIVMDQGNLVAQGTHAQLLNTSPLYAKLAQLQFHTT
ncbi:ATP-binding cassette domain-containing protein [Marinomonas agarivorans]|nr:ATP-binding cassette domain-containing protein [Marinomonas agarivorans]